MKSLYKKTVLDNGIRVVSEKISSVRSISIGIWVDVGSRDEAQEESGISHFLEHMVFKGTKKRTAKEIAQALESVGGILNAFTAREQTCYYAHILDEHLPIAVDVLSDILKNSLLDSQDLEKEKKVIVEEIKDIEDNPGDLIHDIYAGALWPDHPLGRPVIGSLETVSSLNRNNLTNFMQKNYNSKKVVVAASGNVKHEELVKLIEKKLQFNSKDGYPNQSSAPPVKSNIKIVNRETAQTHICLGVTSFPYKHPNRQILFVLNTILGGGMSSRLFQSVRENSGLAYSIYSFVDFFEDSGTFGVYLGTNSQQVLNALNLVLKEISKIKKEKLTSPELYFAKSQIKGNLVIGMESTSNRMNRLARNELFLNEYLPIEKTIAEIEKVKEKQIHDITNELFSPDRLCLALIGPNHSEIAKNLDWGILN
ncbi:MAG: hypothetical protein A2145_02195 [candidate division Zixibacteria bacterium RBG_16_40_9]|nr:MAG: hypothetical protein A2145_02195 [candidate division Zixibacteria bacterium RBG_16_40_9]